MKPAMGKEAHMQTTPLVALALAAGLAPTGERALTVDLELAAPQAAAFEAFTTLDGIRSFFAPGGVVEARVDGLYEIHFFPRNPPGQRGAEGMRILQLQAPSRLAFTWDAPPSIAEIRKQRTFVLLDFEPLDAARTRLRFRHIGWGHGPEWDKAYDYFDRAWRAVVLPRLVHRFAHGPVNWSALPNLEAVAPTLKRRLAPAP
jgi:uncharacterized protein YndB with AHSA1/START domain